MRQYILCHAVVACVLTLTSCRIVLREPGFTDTLESADGVVARGVVVTRAVGETLVLVFATVAALEAGRTLSTARCLVARSVHIKTVAFTKTVLAPHAALTGCKRNLVVGRYIWTAYIVGYVDIIRLRYL